jgi:hypothetical protein
MEIMQVGSSKATPQDRWQRRNGLTAKSYKLRETLVEEFAEACKLTGVSQAGQLSSLMQTYINEVKSSE